MKIKRINTVILLLAFAGITLTGCSNEDLANITPQEEGTGNVSFSIVEKDYEPADNTPKSRAAEETKSEAQDLGDGLMAEVSLMPDTTHRAEAPKTRAINTPTRYTIQAYQGGVKKGELKGTFNGSTFTPDAGQPKSISLPHGTYDFVCFNDKVTANGTQFTVNRSDAATARFTVQRGVVINPVSKQQVTFTMKHAGSAINVCIWYINFSLKGELTNVQVVDNGLLSPNRGQLIYKGKVANPAENYHYTMGTPAGTVPETMVYDLATDATSNPAMGQISVSGEPDANGLNVAAGVMPGWNYPSSRTVFSMYCLPKTDCSKLKLTFTSGEFYGCSLAGKTVTVPEVKQTEANKMYNILVRLYINDQYLYDDGTAGPLAKNSGKNPVGVVIDPYMRVAVALHDVNEGGSDQFQWSNATTTQESSLVSYDYGTLVGSASDYVATGAAFQAADNYVPAISGHSWRIQPLQNFIIMGHSLGRMLESGDTYKKFFKMSWSYLVPSGAAATGFTPVPSSVNFPAMDMTRFNAAFKKVHGTVPSGTYWTNSECKVGSEYKMATIEISGGKLHLGLKSKTETAKVRPFIFY